MPAAKPQLKDRATTLLTFSILVAVYRTYDRHELCISMYKTSFYAWLGVDLFSWLTHVPDPCPAEIKTKGFFVDVRVWIERVK